MTCAEVVRGQDEGTVKDMLEWVEKEDKRCHNWKGRLVKSTLLCPLCWSPRVRDNQRRQKRQDCCQQLYCFTVLSLVSLILALLAAAAT